MISIHAPARGATSGQGGLLSGRTDFNPRSRKGSDLREQVKDIILCKFQSTLPQGERLIADLMELHFKEISIHAPARGATSTGYAPLDKKGNFNPRSRKGSDPANLKSGYLPSHFNPRSRKGSDVYSVSIIDGDHISIHAPARGATSRHIQ